MLEEKGYLNKSFKIEKTPENENLLKIMRQMAAQDGWSFSDIVRAALTEYVQRHAPGNPQLILGHWTKGDPLPKTLEHKHKWGYGEAGGAHWIECTVCGVHQ